MPKSQKYIYLTHAAAVTFVGGVLIYAFDAPAFFKGLPVGMLIVFVAALFRGSMRDEYVERLWNAGTAAAFLAAMASTLGVELVRGFADPVADVLSTAPLFSPFTVGAIVLGAFLAAFHLALWRGR